MTLRAQDWHQRGRQLQEQGQLEAAAEAYQRALTLEPGRLRSLNNLAVLRLAQGREAESLALLNQGLAIAEQRWRSESDLSTRAELAQAWALLLNSRCQWALHHDQFVEARRWACLLLQLQPEGPGLANLGVALSWLNRPSAARRSQWLGLGGMSQPFWPREPQSSPVPLWRALDSPLASASLHQQLCNLATGLLSRDPLARDAWQLLLARLATQPGAWAVGQRPWQGLWNGQAVQRLVIWDEQGYGDALQCLRWLPAACERVAQPTLLLRPALLNLVRERLLLPGRCRLGPLDPALDRPWQQGEPHCPLMGLPVALWPEGGRIEPAGGSLLRRQHQPRPAHRRFGLVWAAGQKDNPEARRSARLRSMPGALLLGHAQAWARCRGASLVALQLGPELEQARPWLDSGDLAPLPPGGDWLATAQLVEQLDLVITVDTAMVHLAGSLGVPCLLLLNQVCDWRWYAGEQPVPWYPSVRALRAQSLNAWEPLLQQVPDVIDAMLV